MQPMLGGGEAESGKQQDGMQGPDATASAVKSATPATTEGHGGEPGPLPPYRAAVVSPSQCPGCPSAGLRVASPFCLISFPRGLVGWEEVKAEYSPTCDTRCEWYHPGHTQALPDRKAGVQRGL